MPEGDTIRRLADAIDGQFKGRVLLKSEFRHPRYATTDLSGTTLVEADARGKNLLLRFDNDQTILIHLKMDGRIYRYQPPRIPLHRRRLELTFDEGCLVGVDLPVLKLFRTKDEAAVMGKSGPDVCGEFDLPEALKNLQSAKNLPINQALLDQRLLSGLGNIYAVETPFIVGVNPMTPVGQVDEMEALLNVAVALIRSNAERGFQDTTGDIRIGRHWVLSNQIRQCRWCGANVERRNAGQTAWRRRTAWCAACQAPENTRADIERARRILRRHPCRRSL